MRLGGHCPRRVIHGIYGASIQEGGGEVFFSSWMALSLSSDSVGIIPYAVCSASTNISCDDISPVLHPHSRYGGFLSFFLSSLFFSLYCRFQSFSWQGAVISLVRPGWHDTPWLDSLMQ